MNLFDDFLGSIASDFVSAVADRWSISAANSAIETCCQQLGWSIHSRTNDGRMCLQFNDPLIGTRAVMVSIVDRGAYVSFMAISPVTMPAKEIPASILGYMLERNVQPFVLWQLAVGNNGSALFTLNYRVPTPGLHPEVFKRLCQTMTAEALAFDSRMQRAGLLE
jgi:hypothetical protein